MKKALYYAIRTGSSYNPIIAVTTEKGHRWHGREVKGDMPTHGVLSDLSGRFADVESAIAMRARVAELADSYDKARKVLQVESSKLYAAEREAMELLLKGEVVALAKPPVIVWDDSAYQLNKNGWHMPSLNEGMRLSRICNGVAMPGDVEAGEKNECPTDDAWLRACRALHWRTAELRFHGHEPIALPEDAPQYPPDDFDFNQAGGSA